MNGWHRIFWRNRSSTTRSHNFQHFAEITQSRTFAALIRLSTTTHNLLTFNISEMSSNISEKLNLLANKHLWTYTRLILVPRCRVTRSAATTFALFSHQKKKGSLAPGQSSPAILLSLNSFDS